MTTRLRKSLLALALLTATVAAAVPDRPNVLLIVSEDNGPELGCYGDPFVRTPNLDRLAADGARFENAWTTHAVCSVSRASFLTGLYPFQSGQIGLATHRYAMFREWDNAASLLKAHGYRTGLIGKLHVNPESAFPFDFRWNDRSAVSFAKRDVRRIARTAGDFFTSSAGKPFFLSVNFSDAHFPLLRQQHGLPEDPLGAGEVRTLPFIGADSPRLRQGTADYYNCLMRLDTGVGVLLAELEQRGASHETLVIYLGDHGAQFSRGKATCYEGGLRIPLILRWPEQTKPGTVCHELVSVIDILPTILQAARLPARATLPGRSLLPLAAGRHVAWRRYLFAERTAYSAASFFPQRAVRDERFKLILNLLPGRKNPVAETYRRRNGAFFEYGTSQEEIDVSLPQVRSAYATWSSPPDVELYDLSQDPHELRNLADAEELSKVKSRLLAGLSAHRVELADPLLDAEKLRRLEAEHDEVSRIKRGGRYRAGDRWRYLEYLRETEE